MDLLEQRIAIAEACGYRWWKSGGDLYWLTLRPANPLFSVDKRPAVVTAYMLLDTPKYLTSYKAMAEAEKKLKPAERAVYAEILATRFCGFYDDYYDGWGSDKGTLEGYFALATLTPAQKAEAFLRTRCIWVDD